MLPKFSTTKHERMAGRAYNRVLSQLTEGWEQAWKADRHHDGGEWSDAAWDKNFDEASEKAAKIVGERFGLDWNKVLCIAEYDMPCEEMYHFLENAA